MGQGIVNCRGCKAKDLKYALKINGKPFVICQTCTLLQRQEDISYELTFDLSSGGISVDYYPYFLTIKQFPKEDMCFFFSLKSIEVILQQEGYKVINAVTTKEGKLEIEFVKMSSLERIRLYEVVKKLRSQFTYFLFSVKKK